LDLLMVPGLNLIAGRQDFSKRKFNRGRNNELGKRMGANE